MELGINEASFSFPLTEVMFILGAEIRSFTLMKYGMNLTLN